MKGRIIGRDGRNIRALEKLTGRRRDHRRDALGRGALELRRRTARDRPDHAGAADRRRADQSGADRGDLRAGQGGDRRANRRGGRAGGARGARARRSIPSWCGCSASSSSAPATARTCSTTWSSARSSPGLIAAELGASVETARRAALLHDIGKAVTHEVEGPHAQVGARIARRHGEPEAVAHAMEAHHNEVEPRTVEAVIVQTADALSGARPGARGDSLEEYVERLRDLEEIASRHDGRRAGLRDASRARDPGDRRSRQGRRRARPR